MAITGYDVSKSGCCPSEDEGFAAKTGYAKSELKDARSRLSPSADSQARAKRTGPTKIRAFHLPERGLGDHFHPQRVLSLLPFCSSDDGSPHQTSHPLII